ncbi:hypothetical protein DPEC_G00204290 [Dallia pectoralis]|uniref:Uncharacterized protein n=1 Tax=Dallia pectoralis TaxID=75939 RepID=A0ACC2G9X8_DALPE|nr:hypothetical protein DPEC_G00204290 [Dallia pectoralis]
MDQTYCGPHPGTNKTDPRRIGRAGSHNPVSHNPGSHSPGSASLGGGSRGGLLGNSMKQTYKRQLEGILSKYTNLIQGWQNRYFVLDPELGQLQYFVNEQGRSQKPRGSLPLIGASVVQSDEAPHMFIVSSFNGELYKLRASDAKEQQFWMNQLQACARRHSDSSAKVWKLKGSDEHLSVKTTTGGSQEVLGSSSSGRSRSVSLLPHLPPASSSPGSQRPLACQGAPSNIVTITHHKSPAAARRARNQSLGRLMEVKEVMSQAEGQQKNLVHSIESLPSRGPLSCLDQDLLLLKATSAATISCLGECLNILQHPQTHSQCQDPQTNPTRTPPSGESVPGITLRALGPVSSPPDPNSPHKGHMIMEVEVALPYTSDRGWCGVGPPGRKYKPSFCCLAHNASGHSVPRLRHVALTALLGFLCIWFIRGGMALVALAWVYIWSEVFGLTVLSQPSPQSLHGQVHKHEVKAHISCLASAAWQGPLKPKLNKQLPARFPR